MPVLDCRPKGPDTCTDLATVPVCVLCVTVLELSYLISGLKILINGHR